MKLFLSLSPYWLSVGSGKFQYSGVFFSVTVGQHVSSMFLLSPSYYLQVSHSLSSRMRGVRCLCWTTTEETEEEWGGEGRNSWRGRGGGGGVRGQRRAPSSSLAIAARLFASCPWPAPGRSSGSRSGAAGGGRAPAPSTGPRPARRHCPGQSLSAWERRKWGQEPASYGLVGRRRRRKRKTVRCENGAGLKLNMPGKIKVRYRNRRNVSPALCGWSSRLSCSSASSILYRLLLLRTLFFRLPERRKQDESYYQLDSWQIVEDCKLKFNSPVAATHHPPDNCSYGDHNHKGCYGHIEYAPLWKANIWMKQKMVIFKCHMCHMSNCTVNQQNHVYDPNTKVTNNYSCMSRLSKFVTNYFNPAFLFSPQLLSVSPNWARMKFSIQKGWQTQRRVNESHSPWLEQFSWQTVEGRRATVLGSWSFESCRVVMIPTVTRLKILSSSNTQYGNSNVGWSN